MNLEQIIREDIIKAIKVLFDQEVEQSSLQVQPTKKEFEGSLTLVCFPLTSKLKKAPEVIGKEIGEVLVKNSEVVRGYNVVKGFLNIVVSDSTWLNIFNQILANQDYGKFLPLGKKVMVEYSSPNTNKPLHLGHLRNNFLGYSVSQILKFRGYEVIKANLINDRGIHICKSMLAYQKYGSDETPQSSGIKGDHLVGKYYVEFDKHYREQIKQLVNSGMEEEKAKKEAPLIKEAHEMLKKWEEGDKEVTELWKKMNGWVYDGFEQTYKMIGVDFDKYYYESDTYLLGKEIVEEGLNKKAFYRKEDNSVWVDLTGDGLDEKLLLRPDGTSVYITQDLGTAELKYKEFRAEQSVYVVGNEQDYHFNVLKLILGKLGKEYAQGIYHLSYGMVDLPSGKMKSREGTVVDADDLVAEMLETAEQRTRELGKIEEFSSQEAKALYRKLALGALKFFLLKVDPKKRMLFNPAESIEFQGNTGPFIQYTFARISSLIRKATGNGINLTQTVKAGQIHHSEREVIEILARFPEKIETAASTYSPAEIAQYVYELAKAYNHFYAELPILNEKDENLIVFRLNLSKVVARVIEKSMDLLGIEVPEKM
ncbi:MAG: arginine--tRNA ligase [Cytophagaceae bacterium]